ncbi:hypothetical protein TPA0906_11590 [Streptomyces olivaceus]|nr:hypothetical protein TPA0906_11590 [Streptomyces olivaceus]
METNESVPLARALHVDGQAFRALGGVTPARAGATAAAGTGHLGSARHPRSRGRYPLWPGHSNVVYSFFAWGWERSDVTSGIDPAVGRTRKVWIPEGVWLVALALGVRTGAGSLGREK